VRIGVVLLPSDVELLELDGMALYQSNGGLFSLEQVVLTRKPSSLALAGRSPTAIVLRREKVDARTGHTLFRLELRTEYGLETMSPELVERLDLDGWSTFHIDSATKTKLIHQLCRRRPGLWFASLKLGVAEVTYDGQVFYHVRCTGYVSKGDL